MFTNSLATTKYLFTYHKIFVIVIKTSLYKILIGIIAVPVSDLSTPADERTRGANKKSFKHIRANTTLGQNSFLYKTIPNWNHLPPAAIESRSIAAFKSQLSD